MILNQHNIRVYDFKWSSVCGLHMCRLLSCFLTGQSKIVFVLNGTF